MKNIQKDSRCQHFLSPKSEAPVKVRKVTKNRPTPKPGFIKK